jgi:putative ABC transport system permease protein
MGLWTRAKNMVQNDRLNREIEEEMRSHIEDAVEEGRDREEARRAFGSMLAKREESRDIRVIPWLDSLRADAIFGWRQLKKRKVTSAAAILSLALAIGACTSAFRIIDAILLRPLPVVHPEQLYSLARQGNGFDGKPQTFDGWAYPDFQLMSNAVKGQAELLALSYTHLQDLTYKSDAEMEKAYLQYVSGSMFTSFGLRPAVGRLLTRNDDLQPHSHPYAVLSSSYWKRRFGQDPHVIGRSLQMDGDVYEIVGVIDGPFTGTEPGTVVDVFVPTMMKAGVLRDDWTWIRVIARVKPGFAIDPLRSKMNAASRAFETDRAKKFVAFKKEAIDRFINQKLLMEPAAAGASGLQSDYRVSLTSMAVLVALVLLIACANVANLMTAQATARAREMALRVAIGAGRWRLVQLVLVESAWLALFSATLGAWFAWWSAPFVVNRISPPDHPAQLALPADWRLLAFGLALTVAVMFLFGLAPALRASAVRPATALKGGANPHSRGQFMNLLIAAQVAFCFLVMFVAGLFAATFDQLSHRPLGFSTERLLVLDTVTQQAESPAFWEQVSDHLRASPGVEAVAMSGWPLLDGYAWNGFISVGGAPPGRVLGFFINVSSNWLDVMKIPLVEGRTFRLNETSPGSAVINQTFVKQYFPEGFPLGKRFDRGSNTYEVVGVVKDAPYRSIREGVLPVAYVPFRGIDKSGSPSPVKQGTFLVRTATSDALALAGMLRREIPNARSGFRVSNIRTQAALVMGQTVRERLLAMLALFFASVALLLAGIALYGVLDYSVVQRRREIGIRMAIGARAGSIARGVTFDVFGMVVAGALVGLVLGMVSVRYIQSLLYQVKPTDLPILLMPAATIVAVAILAAVPAVIHAVRIDPAYTLRSE